LQKPAKDKWRLRFKPTHSPDCAAQSRTEIGSTDFKLVRVDRADEVLVNCFAHSVRAVLGKQSQQATLATQVRRILFVAAALLVLRDRENDVS